MHFTLLKSHISIGLAALLVGLTALAQTADKQAPTSPGKLPLKADLVLSPEFCATKKRQSLAIKDVLMVGKAACPKLEAELNGIFSSLRRVENLPAPGVSAAQVVLTPRFVDISGTEPMFPSSQRKLVILLEWTIQDSAGHTIWLQTLQGSSQHKLGWVITKRGLAELVEAAVGDLARDSAARISAARELQNLRQSSAATP